MKRLFFILLLIGLFFTNRTIAQDEFDYSLAKIDTTLTFNQIETLGTDAMVNTYVTFGYNEHNHKIIRFCFNKECTKNPIFMNYESHVLSTDGSKHYRSKVKTNGTVKNGYVKIWNDKATICIFFPNGSKHVINLYKK